jgi:hypothetical protein
VSSATAGKSGGDQGAAQFDEHVLEGGLGLGPVPGLRAAAVVDVSRVVAVARVPDDGQCGPGRIPTASDIDPEALPRSLRTGLERGLGGLFDSSHSAGQCPPPWPDAVNFDLQGEAEECPDQHDQPEDQDVVERWGNCDGPDQGRR